LLEYLGERKDGQLEREAARRPDATTHLLRAISQVTVATRDLTPRCHDSDYRLAHEVAFGVAQLLDPRAVPEPAQCVDTKPPMAAQRLGISRDHRFAT